MISTVTPLVVDAPAARSKSGHVTTPSGPCTPVSVALTNAIPASSVSTSAMPVASENPMFIIVIV